MSGARSMAIDAIEPPIRLSRLRPGRVWPGLAKAVLLAAMLGPLLWAAASRWASAAPLGLRDLSLVLLMTPGLAVYALFIVVVLMPDHQVYDLSADTGGLRIKYLSAVMPLVTGQYHAIELPWQQVASIGVFELEAEGDPSDNQWDLQFSLRGRHPGGLRVFTIATDRPEDGCHAAHLSARLNALREAASA